MEHLIFKDKGEFKAFSTHNKAIFDSFVSKLEAENIIHINGTTNTDSLNEDDKKLYTLFYRNLSKNWGSTRIETNNIEKEQIDALVVADVPVKKKRGRPRKKVVNTGESKND